MPTEFNINISLSNYGELHNLVVTLSDNGVGLNDVRFGKFSKLFDVEEQSHKGLGRLVYLCYFDKVEVKSVFDNSKQRVFEFNEAFDKDCTITEIEPTLNGSIFRMSGFTGERLGKNEMYFRSKSVYLDLDMKQSVIQNAYILDYKAMVEDADSRNSTFLKILRERFKCNHTK